MPNSADLISIILPTYNSASTIEQAIESILQSTHTNVEFIVVDDGSIDETPDVVEPFVRSHGLRYFRRANAGLAEALNFGISQSHGQFLARMDADDRCHPGRLAAQLKHLKHNQQTVILGGQIVRWDGNRTFGTSAFPTEHKKIVNGLLGGRHVMSHPTVMLRADALGSLKGPYWREGVAEDWDLYLRLSVLGRVSNLNHPVLDYRYGNSGINASRMKETRTNIHLACENHRRRLKGAPELTSDQFLDSASKLTQFKIDREVQALNHYRKAILANRNGSPFACMAFLALSAAIAPELALTRVRDAMSRLLTATMRSRSL